MSVKKLNDMILYFNGPPPMTTKSQQYFVASLESLGVTAVIMGSLLAIAAYNSWKSNKTKVKSSLDEIKKTYANPQWVAGLTLKTGDIDSSGFGSLLVPVSDSSQIERLGKQHLETIRKDYDRFRRAMDVRNKKLNQIVDEVLKIENNVEMTERFYTLRRELDKEFVKWTIEGPVLGGLRLVNGDYESGPTPMFGHEKVKSLPALNADQIVAVGKLMVAFIEWREDGMEYFPWTWPYASDSRQIKQLSERTDKASDEDPDGTRLHEEIIEKLFDQDARMYGMESIHDEIAESVLKTASAFERWIKASIQK